MKVAQYQSFAGFSVTIKTGLVLGIFGVLPFLLYELLKKLNPTGRGQPGLARGLLAAGMLFWLGFIFGLLAVVPALFRL